MTIETVEVGGTKLMTAKEYIRSVTERGRPSLQGRLALAFYMLIGVTSWTIVILCWLSAYLRPLIIAYILWILFFDMKTSSKGGRKLKAVRNSIVTRGLADYAPTNLYAEAKLDPAKQHLFICHPHGILAFGVMSAIGSDSAGFATLFPDVDRKSIQFALDQKKSVALLLGGAEEALYAHFGRDEIILNKRKGFCRLALKNGASLVPVYSFGENELWHQFPNPDGSLLKKFQIFLMKKLTFSLPAIHNFFPKAHPVNVVVGSPIEVNKLSDPTPEQIDRLHKTYSEAIKALYARHHQHFAPQVKDGLQIIS